MSACDRESADARSRHGLEADQGVCIVAALPAQSSLNIAAIIEAARGGGRGMR